jgi:hypothetical protein
MVDGKARNLGELSRPSGQRWLPAARSSGTHGGAGLRGNRIGRRGGGSVLVGNFEDLRQAAVELFEFAERLEKIVPETDWPLAHTID